MGEETLLRGRDEEDTWHVVCAGTLGCTVFNNSATGQNWKGKGYGQPTGEFLNVFLFLLILQRYLRNPYIFPKAKLLEAVGLSLKVMERCLLVLSSCLEVIKQQSQQSREFAV